MYANLKALRESLSMTQKEFASSLDMAPNTYNNYETGVREPRSDFWIAVAQKYNVTIDYLMGFSDDPHSIAGNSKKAPPISGEALKLAKDYDTLDTWGKNQVRTVANNELARCAASTEQAKVIRLPKGKRSNGNLTELDVYDEPAAAGLGNYVDSAPTHHLEQYPTEMIPSKTDFGVLISGTSMEPKIPNGSTVFVQAAPVLDSGEIGVFVLDGQAYCKKLVIDHENHRTLLRSMNPEFVDMEIQPWAEFRTLGRVLDWYTPRFFEHPAP